MKEQKLKKDETLEDVFNGIIEEVDKKQMHFLIEKAKEKWIKQAKSEAIKEFEKFGKKIDLHLSGKCGFKICDECKKLNDEKDECLIMLKEDFKELKLSLKGGKTK